MTFLQITCYLMSFIMSALSLYSNITGRLMIDVSETDGRLVAWKEDDYIEMDSPLTFSSRDKNINKVYMSYDDGKSFSLYLDNIYGNKVVISPEEIGDPVCIRFTSSNNYISRQFKINFLDNTFTDT